ncbi:hypothetical protein ACFYNO_33200 [Kitasatospora sp. NPDC006697]|uniref:hypothetical protein n=1 Tax=Kitasatospora sp. NPDC006697 TaxID=3364020 RepID=UPI0036D137B4
MTNDETTRLDELLERLRVHDPYARLDADDAQERLILRQIARSGAAFGCVCSRPTVPPQHCPPSEPGWTQPTDSPQGLEQAWWDLQSLSMVVLTDGQAGVSLNRFIEEHYTLAGGALVFACLLYLTGRADGARFWWQFATEAGADLAGTGDEPCEAATAAQYFLFLDHARRGEYDDAGIWSRRLRETGFATDRWGERTATPVVVETLPDVSRHITEEHDPLLGTIPLPHPALVQEVCELAVGTAATR